LYARRKGEVQRMSRPILTLGLIAALGMAANGQSRKANIVGGGSPGSGRCTADVRVDSGAEVEVRGDTATLKNTAGAPPQWNRFECTSPMPINPQNFQFRPIEGRGRQNLTRDPNSAGGAATVRIQDDEGGSSNYGFELTWGQESRPYSPPPPPDRQYQDRGPGPDRPYYEDRDRDRGYRPPPPPPPRFTEDQAVQACRDSIRSQASDRFQTANISFQRIGIDDNRG